jgi:flagellar assembly protein FliH
MKPSSKPNPHSRFIPREEIDGVAAWHFSAVDGSADTSAGSDQEGVTTEV